MALRRLPYGLAIVVGLGGRTATVDAQAPAVVQLPSFSTFGVDTSVSVPDRGSASLGGVGRSSTGSTAFGPGLGPGNRSFGRNLSGSSSSVRARVHDMEALDRETLARGKSAGGKSASTEAAVAKRLAAARESSAGQVPSGSVAEARKLRAAEIAAGQADALQTLKRAREAAKAGKTSAAAVFYRLAARDASGELKSQIEKEAAALASKPRGPQVADAGRRPAATVSPSDR